MTTPRSIATAPQDGSTVMVTWTDATGQENHSLARYRSLSKLRTTGGDWDEGDEGWWVFVDGDTQKRIEPHSWTPNSSEEVAD